MTIKRKTFTLIGFVVAALFLTALLIAFSTDRWVESTEDSGFVNIGLWSVCFDQYKPPPWALVDKYMDECFWTLDKELDDYEYLFPSWFKATQVMVTLSLVLGFIAVVVMVINAINCFPFSRHRDFIRLAMCIVAFSVFFIIVILLSISVIWFGNQASNDRNWLERPDNLYLSWSFGFCVLSDFLALIAGLVIVLEFFRLRMELGMSKEPNVYLTNMPPPSNSSYRYSRENIPAATAANRGPESRQPEYAKRFGGSQGSLPDRNADPEVFKVSGSGQLYINRLADEEERRDRQTYADRGRNGYAPQRNDQQRVYSTRTNGDRPDTRNRPGLANGKAGYGDYEEAKRLNQPVLPEYVPKSRSNMDDVATEDSDLDDIPKKDLSDDSDSEEEVVEERTKSKKKSRTSSSDSKKKKKSRSTSDKRKSKKKSKSKYDDDEDDYGTYSKRKSKRRGETSDDERTRSRKRSKDRSTRRKASRSRSRDLNESYSDAQLDSDRESSRGRSRKKKRSGSKARSHSDDRLASSGKSKRNTSKDRAKRKYDEDFSDDNVSGSEYGRRQKTNTRTGRGRDFSDTESLRSKTRRKPELSYSSYYEY